MGLARIFTRIVPMPLDRPANAAAIEQVTSAEADAQRIVDAGRADDTAFTTLAKAVKDGLSGLALLLKGGKAKPADDDDPDAGAGGGDGGGEGGGAGDDPPAAAAKPKEGDEPNPDDDPDGGGGGTTDGPGYEDMRMGGGAGDEYIDATAVVIKLEKEVGELKTANVRLQKSADESNSQLKELRERFDHFLDVYGAVTAPLTKAVLGLHESLRDIPAAVHNPGLDTRRAAVRHAVDVASERTETGITVVQLTKAMKQRICSEDDVRYFKKFGKFTEDEAANTDIVTKVKAL